MRLDLHVHSKASDGSWSPEAVVRGAARGGLHVLALTDHDNTAGFAAAAAVGREVDVQVVPALEVSSTYQTRDVHVLGYFVDPDARALAEHAGRAGRRRHERMHQMLERLRARGIDVSMAAVEEAAGPARAVVGRPHLARALVAAGYASSVPDAFDCFIGDQHEAFVPTALLEPVEAVELILAAGGVPMWAHPPGDLVDGLLPALIRAGLRGLEVYRPRSQRTDIVRLEGICRTSGLLMSGGSDWHSPDGGASLGDFWVDHDEVGGLLAAGGM
ncbi:MAG: PHP domain-containing protein [Gemmatimonadetes bacterium]|nr:PHP domain-containing protein [Gemmatimonadota bacterium]